MLAVALPWFVAVMLREDQVLSRWTTEVIRHGATDLEPDRWYAYVALVGWVFPWSLFFVAGLVLAIKELLARRGAPIVAGLLLVVLPLLVMSFFKDRKDRYQLPMAPAAAVVAAWGVREHLRNRRLPRGAGTRSIDPVLAGAHWTMIGFAAVALPIAGMLGMEAMRTVGGDPWYTPGFALGAAALSAGVLILSIVVASERDFALPAGTAALMLMLMVVFLHGYRDSPEGRSDLRPLAESMRAFAPAGAYFFDVPPPRRPPEDLAIYLPGLLRRSEGFASLPSGPGPRVLVFVQLPDRPLPDLPAKWTRLDDVRRGKRLWHALGHPGETARP